LGGILIAIAAGLAAFQLTAQVQTDVPPPVASHWMTNPAYRQAKAILQLPKLFLRLCAKTETSDFPTTLARFYEKLLIDSKRLAFYHFLPSLLRIS
jgi:hypothetical protein